MRLNEGWRVLSIVLAAALLSGCPERSEVWLSTESTADRPVFRIATERGGTRTPSVGVFRIDPCNPSPGIPDAMWIISRGTGARAVSKIMYGRVPPGYEENAPAAPLTPGCYRAYTSGTGQIEFETDATGSIKELPRDPRA
jgi:hypothetical protein